MKNAIFILVFTSFFNQISAQKTGDLEIAKITASVTLWYPKAKIYAAELQDAMLLMQKKGEDEWIAIHAMERSTMFIGFYLDAEYNKTDKPGKVDSEEVADWIFIEKEEAIGGFVIREEKWKTLQQIAKKFNSKPDKNRMVSSDFIDKSKLKGADGNDTMGFYILKTRYPGGIEGFYKFVSSTIVYPEYARCRGLEGYTYASFKLMPTGEIKDIKIIRTIGGSTENSVLDMYREMPVWKSIEPDETVILNLPVNFKLQ